MTSNYTSELSKALTKMRAIETKLVSYRNLTVANVSMLESIQTAVANRHPSKEINDEKYDKLQVLMDTSAANVMYAATEYEKCEALLNSVNDISNPAVLTNSIYGEIMYSLDMAITAAKSAQEKASVFKELLAYNGSIQ